MNAKVQSVSLLAPVLSIKNISNTSMRLLLDASGKLFSWVEPFLFIQIPKNLIIKWIPIPTMLVKAFLGWVTGMHSDLIDFDSQRTKELVVTMGWTSSYNIVMWDQRQTQDLHNFDLGAKYNLKK